MSGNSYYRCTGCHYFPSVDVVESGTGKKWYNTFPRCLQSVVCTFLTKSQALQRVTVQLKCIQSAPTVAMVFFETENFSLQTLFTIIYAFNAHLPLHKVCCPTLSIHWVLGLGLLSC